MICQHHWRIETPNGPLSLGRCRKCGAERMFRNWDYDVNFNQRVPNWEDLRESA